jgi:hypothetical protein
MRYDRTQKTFDALVSYKRGDLLYWDGSIRLSIQPEEIVAFLKSKFLPGIVIDDCLVVRDFCRIIAEASSIDPVSAKIIVAKPVAAPPGFIAQNIPNSDII